MEAKTTSGLHKEVRDLPQSMAMLVGLGWVTQPCANLIRVYTYCT